MTDQKHSGGEPRTGDQIVRRPRMTDAVGRSLRGAFETTALPSEMVVLIERLDRTRR